MAKKLLDIVVTSRLKGKALSSVPATLPLPQQTALELNYSSVRRLQMKNKLMKTNSIRNFLLENFSQKVDESLLSISFEL